MLSVAMAVCNGEKYLDEQIASILPQLAPEDELVISLNPSTDRSGELLQAWAERDARIRLVQCPVAAVVANFASALGHCRGELILCSDQDDLWLPGKAERLRQVFREPAVMAAVHAAELVDAGGKPLPVQEAEKPPHDITIWQILRRNEVRGCCLALRRTVLDIALPLPEALPMHDSALGLAAACLGRVTYLPERLLRYRRHGDNYSPSRRQRIGKMLRDRMQLVHYLTLVRRRMRAADHA